MSERTAKWITWLGPVLFALSMIVPPQAFPDDSMRQNYGFQLAVLSYMGAFEGFPICIVGFAANVGFLVASLLLLIRVARGRPLPSYRFIARWAMLIALAMLVSRIWLVQSHIAYWFAPGFLLWLGGALFIAIGCWRLRVEPEFGGHGFAVIPVATAQVVPISPESDATAPDLAQE